MPVNKSVREAIRKFALKNAMDYGKAAQGAVMNKVIFAFPDTKSDMKGVALAVKDVVDEVNKLPKARLESEFEPYRAEFEEAEKEKAEKTAGPNIHIDGAEKGKVVTRAPPEPGGYIQIGNAKQALLSDEVAKMYDGKVNLYFDDTNPEKCKQEFVDGIRKDYAWLGIKFAKEYYASDHIEKVYDAGRKLLKQGDAYVCTCSDETVKAGRESKIECEHRQQSQKQNVGMFEDMLKGKYDEGGAIVRLMGEMKADNATLRDPTLFRIKKVPHYRQGTKYVVWPTYHINTIILDNMYGVTDVIRGKEYEIWEPFNRRMLTALGIPLPRFHYEARLRIRGNTTAKRVIREMLKDGVISGWDDPRLLTVIALRRRGIMPDAIRNFVLRAGFSKTDALVPIDMLLAENKKFIDPIAKHLYFVPDPVEVTAEGAKSPIKLRLNPTADLGYREYKVGTKFYVPKEDLDMIKKGSALKLKDLGAEPFGKDGKRGVDERIVQWVSEENKVECSVLVPGDLVDDDEKPLKGSMKVVKGYVESYAKQLKEHDIVQFERFGYCILDDKKKNQFIFISK